MQQQVLESLATIAGILWPVALLVVVAFITATSWFKETVGKIFVKGFAWRKLRKEGFYLIKNFALPTENGNIEIDHILVSNYGVFLVETVNLRGWISGVAHHRTWKQEIKGQTLTFPNPLMHNARHIEALFKMLNLDDHQVHRVILFTGDTVFKSEMPVNVIRSLDYLSHIRSKQDEVMVGPQLESLVANLQSGELAEQYKTHWQNIREVQGSHWTME